MLDYSRTELDYKPLAQIEVNRLNPREPAGKEDVSDLKKSIRSVGVLVPLLVFRKKRTKNKFVLLEGERRYRACTELFEETREKRFSEVPVNILRTHPSKFKNYQTMFNVHTKRKKWSRAAEAEALGKLRVMGKKRANNTGKLVDLTGLDETAVEEDLTFLRFPDDLSKLAFDGKLREYYLILLGRNLKVLEDIFPLLFEKYKWETIVRTLILKVQNRNIRRTRDFNYLSSLAKTCIQFKDKDVFTRAFDKLMTEPAFNMDDMAAFVDRELGYRADEAFSDHCKAFAESLSSHLKHRNYKVQKKTLEILLKIAEEIARLNSEST